MTKDSEKNYAYSELPEPPAGLFDRIILAIKREQELQKTRKLVFGFLTLLIVSLVSVPFSWFLFASQMQDSGVIQFIITALGDVGLFFIYWKEFSLAIVESLPIVGITIFAINMILVVFTVRLFLYKKRILVRYLINNFI